MATTARRQKISTTVSPETTEYLESLVRSGRAANLAEAVDLAVARVRAAEQRARLEQDTAAYFQALSRAAARAEARLAEALAGAADEVDFAV